MNKREVIEQLLRAITTRQWNASAAFGGASGVDGMVHVQPADMSKAIEAWLQHDESSGIRQVVDTLHITGALTDDAYDKIMEAIDSGEK